jgi:RNA polymerase-binding transcription factor DksA
MESALKHCETTFIDQVCSAIVQIQEEASTNEAEAMAQLHSGTYGYCLDCLVRIPSERLAAVTFGVRCAACEEARLVARP